MTPATLLSQGPTCGIAPFQFPGPGSVPILPPQLVAGNLTYLPAGSFPTVNIRTNPFGGYYIDFGLPEAPVSEITPDAAAALFAKLLPDNGTYRVVSDDNGTRLEIWNPDQQVFQTVQIRGAPGQEQLEILQPDA